MHPIRGIVVVALALLLNVPAHAQWRGWKGRAQDDVAAVHVAVQSVAPFEVYVESLQPTFTLSVKEAMDYSVAQTRTHGSAQLRAIQAALDATLGVDAAQQQQPQSPAPDNAPAAAAETPAPPAGGGTGTGAQTPAGDAAAEEEEEEAASSSTLPAAIKRTLAANTPGDAVSLDPYVHHSAAAALLQYIALLNNYVRDAAVNSGTRPYVVRLLVTVLPTASTRGYDAYTTISFFTDPGLTSDDGRFAATRLALDSDLYAYETEFEVRQHQKELVRLQVERAAAEAAGDAKTAMRCRSEIVELERQIRFLSIDTANADIVESAQHDMQFCEVRPLQVVPLLVTDNIESSLHRDNVEYVRNLSLALQAIRPRNRFGFGARSQLNDLAQTLTRNLNSLMTVGQVGSNSIRVRLGAMYGNRTDVMIPRTYSVTALVLMPTAQTYFGSRYPSNTIGTEVLPCSIAAFTAQSEFRDARSGKLARSVSYRDITYAVQDLLGRIDGKTARAFADAAMADDYGRYTNAGRQMEMTEAEMMELWPRLQSLVARSSLSRGRFQAPLRDGAFFSNRTYSSVIDDGVTSRVRLQGGAHLVGERINGTLLVKVKSGDQGQQERDLYLPAARVDVDQDRRAATLHFPSLDKLVKAENVKAVYADIRYLPGVRNWHSSDRNEGRWYLQLPEMEPTPSRVSSPPPPPKPFSEVIGNRQNEIALTYYGPLKTETAAQAAADAPKPLFTVTANVDTIIADKGTGKVSLLFKHDKPEPKFDIFFDVDGADVVRLQPEVKPKTGEWSVANDDLYRLELENLVPNTEVTIKTWRLKDDKESEKDKEKEKDKDKADDASKDKEKSKVPGPTMKFHVRTQ